MDALYRSSLAIVFQGRAEDILPGLEKGSVDCLITDPPYGQSYAGSGYRTASRVAPVMEGDHPGGHVTEVLKLSLRALRSNRHLYVFGPDRLKGLPVTEPGTLIWDKGKTPHPGGLTCWSTTHEQIRFTTFVPSQAGRDRGDGRLAVRLRRGSVLSVPRKNSRAVSRHPTEKPVALLRQLVEASSCMGETVLDPYAGSGSTGVAAVLTGRRAVCIEVDPGYCQTMVNRIKEAEGLALEMSRL